MGQISLNFYTSYMRGKENLPYRRCVSSCSVSTMGMIKVSYSSTQLNHTDCGDVNNRKLPGLLSPVE